MYNDKFLMKRQKDSYGCGPIAIYNTKIWYNLNNKKLNISSITSLYKRCKTTRKAGTVPKNMTRVLEQEFGLLPRRTSDKTRIKNALKAGNGVILLYRQYDKIKKEYYEHYIFIYKGVIPLGPLVDVEVEEEKRGDTLSLVNELKDALIYKISFDDLDEYLEKHKEYFCIEGDNYISYPCAWIIPNNLF